MPDKSLPSLTYRSLVISLLVMFYISSCSVPINTTPALPLQPSQTTEVAIDRTQAETPFPTKTPPSHTETPPVCAETTGTILDKDISSELLEEDVNIKIYLPPCYESNPDIRYPVLYMLHGQMSQNDQWIHLGLLSTMDELIADNVIQPFIIVLPNETRTNIDPYNSGYGTAIVEEIIPYVEKNYRVCEARDCRAIGGLSRGGNWAVNLGFAYPELFTAIGAHSTPLFYGEITNINRISSDEAFVKTLPVFYIDVGHKDPDLTDVLTFNATLQEFNIPHQYSKFLGYHDEDYWSAHVQEYLLWYDKQLISP